MKKKRVRKQKVPVDDQESNAVTTDDGAQVCSRLSRTEINEIVGVVEPVTSTSGMTARGTSTASYSTAAMPTIEISTAHNAISSANTSLPETAVMHQVEPQPLPRVLQAIRVAPEIQQYWTGKANRWQMSSLGVRYVETITTPSREVAPEPSPGYGVSSTQPTPIDVAPSVSLLAPPGTRSPKHRTTTTGYRNTVSIHEQLYADGWNNGEGTSTDNGEVDDYTSAWLTQLTLDLAKENRQPKTEEPRRMPAPRETYSKTRNTPHRENPEIPRRVIQDDFSERRRVRRELPRTRETELRKEEEAGRRYQPPPPRPYQVDGHSTRVVSDSDASREGREYLQQRKSAWMKPQGGRSSGEREDDRRFPNPAHVRKDAHHQEKVSRKEE